MTIISEEKSTSVRIKTYSPAGFGYADAAHLHDGLLHRAAGNKLNECEAEQCNPDEGGDDQKKAPYKIIRAFHASLFTAHGCFFQDRGNYNGIPEGWVSGVGLLLAISKLFMIRSAGGGQVLTRQSRVGRCMLDVPIKVL